MALTYTLLIGIPLCFVSIVAGLTMIAFGAFLCVTVIFLPIGVPMIAAGATAIALGTRVVTLR